MAEFMKLTMITIYVGEDVFYEGIPLYKAIMNKAMENKIAGCTTIKCDGGYGSKVRGQERRFLVNFSDPINLPIMLKLVDTKEQIEKIYPFLIEHLKHGMANVTEVDVLLTDYIKGQITATIEERKKPKYDR